MTVPCHDCGKRLRYSQMRSATIFVEVETADVAVCPTCWQRRQTKLKNYADI